MFLEYLTGNERSGRPRRGCAAARPSTRRASTRLTCWPRLRARTTLWLAGGCARRRGGRRAGRRPARVPRPRGAGAAGARRARTAPTWRRRARRRRAPAGARRARRRRRGRGRGRGAARALPAARRCSPSRCARRPARRSPSTAASPGWRARLRARRAGAGRGEFAVRGGLVDAYPALGDPLRVEFWGDEVESLRTFSVYSQRTTGNTRRARWSTPRSRPTRPLPGVRDRRCTQAVAAMGA